MANQKRCDIQGLGDVCLTFSDGYKLTLRNVRYVPDLNHNLMSCAALEEEGLEGRWGKGIMKHKVQFPASQNPNPVSSSSILDYVHADVWGPSNISTHGGNKYFLSIIDNFSRKVFVFLMKHKSDVFENFRKWKILVENQTGKKLKVLRTDNGLEFCNQSFSNLCDECGIKRHKTNPYTPQQNGVAERMNRTLLEKVRCMLISSGLPKSFWGETLVTAAFLINRSPSVPLNGQIPESVWTGNAVDISSLRVFGCSAFVHQSVDKLAPRSQKCVFIGYPDGIKGYRLWLRSQPGFKVLISKDVIFNENEMPCLDDSQDKNNDNLDLTFNKVEDNQQGEGNEEEPSTVFPENTNSEGLDDYLLARDRNRREPRIPARYNDFHIALNVEPNEPSSVEEALKSENSKNWLSAMAEEMKSLKDNNTWVLVPKPKSCSVVDCKWIFKIKEEDTSKRFKARLVAKGFTQKEGIDYTEIFSPVVKYTTVRIILALTAHFNWELKQMDVKTAFLHGVELTGYVDSNYANDRDSRRSTTSYIFTLCGSCITWKSQLQQIVALSTTEAEYIAATEAFKEALWLEGIVKEIGFLKQKITIFSDSQSAIQLCKNPVFHDRTKHIDVRNPLKNGDDDNTLTRSLDSARKHKRAVNATLGGVTPTTISGWPTQEKIVTEYEQKIEEIRQVLQSKGEDDPSESLVLVDAIQRVGLSSYYEQEIETILRKRYVASCSCTYGYYSLHDVSLFFRLLRQQGHYISPDVFNNFKDKDGRFRRNLLQDIRGLMELHEAAQLSFQGEHILDEAASFSSHRLRECLPEMDNDLSRMITGKLKYPYHKTIAKLTRKDFLQDLEGINGWGKTLRELTLMDLRKGQSVYQGELAQVSKWWNELGLAKEIKTCEESTTEMRMELTKAIAFVYLIDDIFDVVGTLDELTIFTEAVNKWDYAATDTLPDYMKMCYRALLDTTNGIGHEIYKRHGHDPIDSLKTSWERLCDAYLTEAKWFASGDLPTAAKYLENGKVTTGAYVVLVHLFFLSGLGYGGGIRLTDVFQLVSSVATILRLWDDLGSAKDEHQDGRDGSYMECYRNDHRGYQGHKHETMSLIQ
ncbi:UNVERIFIED_CONTAM: Tricyclene synthase 0e23, chloroplastic [Sesamum angustifolium]|uniref:Tricyclene synthase 0e23, chloroplastic n=3 Tax=Sesamum angustifolium TaxID=2727405 RepID=A0AAW2PC79_9LAMI